jgi:phage terminase small subunit
MTKLIKAKTQVSRDSKLTPKQERFCQEYVIDLNGTQAAIRAGYSKKTAKAEASRLLTNVNLLQRVSELQKKVSEKMNINFEWVLQRFIDISNRCMEVEPVRDHEGNPTGEYRFDSSGAIKATAEIGKLIGAYSEDNKQKTDLTVNGFSWDILLKTKTTEAIGAL